MEVVFLLVVLLCTVGKHIYGLKQTGADLVHRGPKFSYTFPIVSVKVSSHYDCSLFLSAFSCLFLRGKQKADKIKGNRKMRAINCFWVLRMVLVNTAQDSWHRHWVDRWQGLQALHFSGIQLQSLQNSSLHKEENFLWFSVAERVSECCPQYRS